MAICFNCGALMHEDDMGKHVCNPANVVKKGKEKIPSTTEKDIL